MIFLISYNYIQSSFDSKMLHETITNLRGVGDWWHYLPDLYLVDSTVNSAALAEEIILKHPGLLFFVTKVDLSQRNGVLNKDAWDWINKKTSTKLRLRPIQSPKFSNILPQIKDKPAASTNMSFSELLKKIRE